ncbi:MAG TPA: ABC transporter substrate-binding protein [Stellaceae bacterium]|nr:ABC transporter substrate-binding protein [Stellaceae bacterium]
MKLQGLWPGGAALGLAVALSVPAQAEDGPVRIGLLTVKTGPLAEGGIQMEEGLTLCLKERHGMMAGRKVELIIGDTGGNPAGAKTKVQELVERDKVDVLQGPLAAFEAYAIADNVAAANIPWLPLAAAEDLSQRRPVADMARVLGTSSQDSKAMADYAVKTLHLKRAVTISDDFAYGHETVGGFHQVFEADGGEVVKKLWPPLNTADYTPYLAQIAQVKDADAVFMGFAGSNPVRFIKQFAEFGLKKKLILLGNGTAADAPILRFLGDEAVGIYGAASYATTYGSPQNQRFLADFRAAYKVDPGLYSVATYLGCELVDNALQALKGETQDKAALIKAVRDAKLADSPRGPLRLDDYGNAVGDTFIRKIALENGKLVDTLVKTYPDVSQFWTFDAKKFLAQPVYSRDFPPLTHGE